MFTDTLNGQIARAASAHGLPPELVAALVQAESGGNPSAVRYEPAFYDRYIAMKPVRTYGSCSSDTERRLRACSFGLMQIMGVTARERGFDGPFLTALCDPDIGLLYGCKHLAWLKNRYFDVYGWPGVIAAYNSGSPRRDGTKYSNQSYVDNVCAAALPWRP